MNCCTQDRELLTLLVASAGIGFAQRGAPLFDRLRSSVESYAFVPFRDHHEIVPARLEQNVVLVGALLLAPGV